MIVRKSSRGLHIIHQAAHGLLAGKIACELQKKIRPVLWLDTLVAIVEHDDHQLDFKEKNYLSELGIPMDFTEDKEVSSEQVLKRAKRVMGHAKSKSLWTAMLVSFHLEFLYGHLRHDSKWIKEFLVAQTAFRKSAISHFDLTKAKAKSVYEMLRFCDRCSLILCKDEIPDAGRKLEINTSIAKKTYYLYKKKNGKLTVDPWCFERNRFAVGIEETLVVPPKFKNQMEFKKVLEKNERNYLEWEFEK